MTKVEDRQNSDSAKGENLGGRLCALLTEQIAFARCGNMGQVERLGCQVDAIMSAMTPAAADRPWVDDAQRNHLQRLYDELVLVLRAEQADVQAELKQLQQVKRVVGVYNRRKQRR